MGSVGRSVQYSVQCEAVMRFPSVINEVGGPRSELLYHIAYFFTMAFCLKGKAMVMTPPVSPRGRFKSERLGENKQSCY